MFVERKLKKLVWTMPARSASSAFHAKRGWFTIKRLGAKWVGVPKIQSKLKPKKLKPTLLQTRRRLR
jgi:hypothetical protein